MANCGYFCKKNILQAEYENFHEKIVSQFNLRFDAFERYSISCTKAEGIFERSSKKLFDNRCLLIFLRLVNDVDVW